MIVRNSACVLTMLALCSGLLASGGDWVLVALQGAEGSIATALPLMGAEASTNPPLYQAGYEARACLAELDNPANLGWTWPLGKEIVPAPIVGCAIAGRIAKLYLLRHRSPIEAQRLYWRMSYVFKNLRTLNHPDFKAGGKYYLYGILQEKLCLDRYNMLAGKTSADWSEILEKFSH